MKNLSFAILPVLNGNALQLPSHPIKPNHLGLVANVNLRMAQDLFPDHLAGFQFFTPNQQCYAIHKLDQKKALFGGAVSSPYDGYRIPL